MNMTTNIDNIPLKTNKNNEPSNDDSDDPMVKDILNEFQQELEINTRKTSPTNNYQVNIQPQETIQERPIPLQKKQSIQKQNIQTSYYNQIYINKTIIIIIIIALVFSPLILPVIIEKSPIFIINLFL